MGSHVSISLVFGERLSTMDKISPMTMKILCGWPSGGCVILQAPSRDIWSQEEQREGRRRPASFMGLRGFQNLLTLRRVTIL